MSILVDLIGQNVPNNPNPFLNKEMKAEDYNFTSFASRTKLITPELLKNTPDSLENHPEFGILPSEAPCIDCYELIAERTPYKRKFIRYGTNEAVTLHQQAYEPYNYTDLNGWIRSIDKRLYPSVLQNNVFTNYGQPYETKIDFNSFEVSIFDVGKGLIFNKNLKLYSSLNGNKQLIASADWSNYTIGQDGASISNVFPGVDMEIIAANGGFKTNYILKNSFSIPIGDYLVIEDDFNLPSNSSFDYSSSYLNQDGLYVGRLDVIDNLTNLSLFNMEKATVYDDSSSSYLNGIEAVAYKVDNGKLGLYISLTYIGNNSRVFPITIDPLVSSSNTRLQASIGAGFLNWGAWLDGCDYFMTVASPANCTITDIIWKFDYRAQNGAPMRDGGVLFFYNGCRSPMPITNWWYCNSAAGGNCNSGTGVSTMAFFSGCLPAPQCASYNMNFQLEFFERYDFDNACGGPYIVPNSNWIMTVEGRTIEQNTVPTSSAGTTLCNLASTNLTATGSFGVPPYSYSWTPGPIVGNPINVNAPQNTSTTYTCTITDACGRTATNSITINKSLCLPVKLTSFTAKEVNNEFVELNWVTETEVNNDFFTLERSNDGKEFLKLYEIEGAGNSSVTLSYQKIDSNPLMGISYYRLKQTDFNGDYEYSNIVTVKIERHFGDISVYPNPLHGDGFITFNSKINGAVKVEILNVIGEKVYEKEYEIMIGSNKIKFSSKKMTQGIYFVKIFDSSGTSSIKFAKN
jgi:hypothetical protein